VAETLAHDQLGRALLVGAADGELIVRRGQPRRKSAMFPHLAPPWWKAVRQAARRRAAAAEGWARHATGRTLWRWARSVGAVFALEDRLGRDRLDIDRLGLRLGRAGRGETDEDEGEG